MRLRSSPPTSAPARSCCSTLCPQRPPGKFLSTNYGRLHRPRRRASTRRCRYPRAPWREPAPNRREPTGAFVSFVREIAVTARNQTAAVIGAGDFIGSEIAKRFAAEGFTLFVGRRQGDKLAPLVKEIEATGGTAIGRELDARKEEEVVSFLSDADKHAPLEVCVFNIGANVNFPLLDTTERVFRKVWEMACYSGFLAGREAARLMLPHGRGSIFFTGATASLRGGVGFAAFASAKFGLRAGAQATAR